MRSYVNISIVILVLAGLVFATAADVPARQYRSADAPRNADLLTVHGSDVLANNSVIHDQVSLCNLVNALWLSEDQLSEIFAILEPRMAEVEKLVSTGIKQRDDAEYGRSMEELRDTLMRGEEPDMGLKKRVLDLSSIGRDAMLDYAGMRKDIAGELYPVLTENQLFILGSYKKCLFNQDDPLHPERVGQASSTGRVASALERLRRTPADRRQEHIDRSVMRLADYVYRDTLFAMDPAEEEQRLRGLIAEALDLDNEEFAIRAEEIAAEMTVYLEARDQMNEDYYNLPTGMRDTKLDKLAENFVIPGAVKIVQARLDLLTGE